MAKISSYRPVDQALRKVSSEIKCSLKQINQQATKSMDKGDYGSAEEMVQLGRAVTIFQQEVEALRERWKHLFSESKATERDRSEQTLQWEYYLPILKAIDSQGGSATVAEIQQWFHSNLMDSLKAGDLEVMAKGRPRWKVMISRARRHMIGEGFIEPNSGNLWSITKQGKRALQADIPTKRERKSK